MSIVSIVRCPDYDRERVRSAVEKSLDMLDGLDALLRGKTVLLKPNLLSDTATPDGVVNTHPEIVRAVAERLMRDFGCRVLIGDSYGGVSLGANRRALQNSGMAAVADELRAEIVDFNAVRSERLTNPTYQILREFYVPRAVLEADVIFNLPKFKTHQLTYFTGAVKNMLGVIPGRGKQLVHLAAPKPEAMAAALVEIYQRVRPHVTLLDAVLGMEGNGPNTGGRRAVGLLLASRDGIALDAAAESIMGFKPGDVLTTVLGHERGLGIGRLDQIDIRGEALESVRIPDYKKPISYGKSWVLKLLPAAPARWYLRHRASYESVVNHGRCVQCGRCIANCPARRLRIEGGRVVSDGSACIACYCCEEVCDCEAIHVVRSPLARAASAARRLLSGKRRRRPQTAPGQTKHPGESNG
jgi:uncharacterized protein (DUF362 family)/NAD-dependent dihydropyrimidine dehydrogenase PreA subunit